MSHLDFFSFLIYLSSSKINWHALFKTSYLMILLTAPCFLISNKKTHLTISIIYLYYSLINISIYSQSTLHIIKNTLAIVNNTLQQLIIFTDHYIYKCVACISYYSITNFHIFAYH